MFGYIKPYKQELKIKEYEIYKAIYCSVCKCLSKNFGLFSKFTLSYDSAFLALLCFSLADTCPNFKSGRCTVNPLKKCNYCKIEEKSIIFAAAVCTIMAYYKVVDDINDSKSLKKLRSILILPIIKHSYKKAKKLYPKVDNIISKQIENQNKIEKSKNASLDMASEPTAFMLSEITDLLPINDKQRRVLREFSYFLGRWIYLIDAADDFYKDQKESNFNPFVNEFLKRRDETQNDIFAYMNEVLNQTLSRIFAAYNLINLQQLKPIIDNIVYLGLLDTQKSILEREKKND